MITVRAVGVDDWAIWRELRLAALADAPHAFTSTLEDWQDASELRWRDRLAAGALNLVAFHEETPAGMIGASDNPDGTVELVSLWVAPNARGRGLGDALVAALLDWAGERTVRLEVFAANTAALDLYRRNGFVVDKPDAVPRPLPHLHPQDRRPLAHRRRLRQHRRHPRRLQGRRRPRRTHAVHPPPARPVKNSPS